MLNKFREYLKELCVSRRLTKTESKVFKEIFFETSNYKIGDKLNVSHKTIKFHLTQLFCAFNVESRVELMQKVYLKFIKKQGENNG